MRISGATVLLTGASGGIGHAIARRLHADGARLVLTGRRAEVLEPLAAELDARTMVVDLSDPGAVRQLASDATDCDVLVANAALPASGELMSFTPDDIERAIAVNLTAPVLLARLMSERMAAAHRGHVVFVNSLSGKVSAPGSAMYSATKFGLRGFAQGAREDLRASGVGVSTVFPSFISDAGMFASSGAELPRGVRTRSPEQVAAAVVRAIERNRNEIDVAPADLRLGALIAGVAPELSQRVSRLLGGAKISADLAAGHAADPARYR